MNNWPFRAAAETQRRDQTDNDDAKRTAILRRGQGLLRLDVPETFEPIGDIS
jgi:hypothetical protein